MKALRAVAAVMAVSLLVACGGGGPSQPVEDTAPIVRAAGGSPLKLSNAQIRSAIDGVKARSSSLLLTDISYGSYGSDRLDCSGATCVETDSGATIYISDLDYSAITFSPVMTRNGVKIVQGAGRTGFERNISQDSDVYGGWMENGAFFVSASLVSYIQGGETYDFGYAYGGAFGTASGSVPTSGSASWRGVMVGADVVREEGLQGDASLSADFAAQSIDVAFTNVREVTSAGLRNSIIFSDVPISVVGFSQGSRTGNRITGTFYGPGHAEAGGMFEHGSILGAFGAKRQ